MPELKAALKIKKKKKNPIVYALKMTTIVMKKGKKLHKYRVTVYITVIQFKIKKKKKY